MLSTIFKRLAIVKYMASLIFLFCSLVITDEPKLFLYTLIILIGIFAFSNVIIENNIILGNLIEFFLLFVLYAQILLKIFAGTFFSSAMLSNIDLVQDLESRLPTYITGIAIITIIAFIPHTYIDFGIAKTEGIVILCLLISLVWNQTLGSEQSPYFSIYKVAKEYKENQEMMAEIRNMPDMTEAFYKESITPYYHGENTLKERPNVILIMTEGISKSIVDDEREIMPNVSSLEKKGISFTNYYNHTFATFRGIIGQLYSGYQLKNDEENTLISLAGVLENNGYDTSFINPEPANLKFSKFLKSMDFNRVIEGEDNVTYTGPVNSISDKEMYEILYNTVSEYDDASPYFVAVYTFGTHVGLDSVDKKFEDGSNFLLNRFYNSDYWFGEFLNKMEREGRLENTLIVFTGDHCTYADMDYTNAFPDSKRDYMSIDSVPLILYHPGIEPEEIDVEGRNSLDLAPTILDYIRVYGSNYFLGCSLFSEKDNNNSYDCFYHDEKGMQCTEDGEIRDLTEVEEEFFSKKLVDYFAAKIQIPKAP